MKRKVLLLALLVTTMGAMAQTKSADSTKLVLDRNLGRNWFVSVGGGALYYKNPELSRATIIKVE